MVKPLYPLSDISPEKRKRLKDAEKAKAKAKKEYILQLCKNPYLISVILIVIVLASVLVIHSKRSSNTLNASAPISSNGSGDESSFSWKLSNVFTSGKTKDIGVSQKEQLKQMGIDDKAESLEVKIEAKNLREERKILAMRKYEASRQTAERRAREKEEQRQKLMSNTSQRLKEAIMAAEDSNMLGLMKLEGFLDDSLRNTGGENSNIDLYIIAYEHLAKAYQRNNREEKAKEAYLNAFKLMKSQAPESQASDWDNAISNIEQIRAKTTR